MEEEDAKKVYEPQIPRSLAESSETPEHSALMSDLEQQEQDQLIAPHDTQRSLYPIEETIVFEKISNEADDYNYISFVKPSEMSSDSDSNDNSSSSDDSSDSSSQSDNRQRKVTRENWVKSKEDDESNSSNENEISIVQFNLDENLTKIINSDDADEIGNIELLPKLQSIIDSNIADANELSNKMNDKDRKRYLSTLKALNPHNIDGKRKKFAENLRTMIEDDNTMDNNIEQAIDAYIKLLEMKTKIRRFKFRIDRKLGLDMCMSPKINTIYTNLMGYKLDAKIRNNILSAILDKNKKITKYKDDMETDDVSMLGITVSYTQGIELKIGDESYQPETAITAMEYNTITANSLIDPILKSIIQQTRVMIFDVSNMIRSMNLLPKQINDLALALNDHGITTVAIVDNDEITIENATINVVEEKYGHDDITSILYAIAYNAVIITNDTHKEFKRSFNVCKTHNTILARVNESCNVTDDKQCVLTNISPNKPRYASIKSYKDNQDYLTVTFDAPIIRFRGNIKKHTQTVKIRKNRNDVAKRWFIKTTGNTPIMINTIKTSFKTASYNVLTFNFNNSTNMVINNNKMKSIAYLLNSMSNQKIQIIKRGLRSSLMIDNNKIVIKDIQNNKIILQDNVLVDRIRADKEQEIISNLFGDFTALYRTQSKVKTLFDVSRNTMMANTLSILITRTSMDKRIAVAVNNDRYYLIGISDEVIDLIESQTIDIMNSAKTNDIRDILPITNNRLTQHVQLSPVVWNDESINELVELSVGQKDWKPLDVTKFVTGDIYWDSRYNHDVEDLGTLVGPSDITNIASNDDDLITIDNRKTIITYYDSGRSGTIYDEMKRLATTRKVMVKYTSTSNTPNITSMRLGKRDSVNLFNAVNKPVRDKVHLIIEDIVRTYRTLVTDSCLVCLPPMIWAFYTDKMTYKNNSNAMLIEIQYIYKYIKVTSYVSLTNSMAKVAFKLQADYKVLYPAIAMRYGNNYEHVDFDYTYMDYILENGLGMMRDDDQIYENLENYKNYYSVFALPLIYAGFAPSSVLTKFKPVIVQNIVVDYILGGKSPMAEFLDDAIMEPALWLGCTDVGFIYPMKRMMKENTSIIDINVELHSIIDELFFEPVEQELKYPMFLMVFRLMYPWQMITDHLSKCYGLSVDEFMTPQEVAQRMIYNNNPCCACVIDEQLQMEVLGNITNYPQEGTKTITTSDAKIMIENNDISTRITKMYEFKSSVLMNTIPLSGNIIILDIVKENAQHVRNRMNFVKSTLANQPSVMCTINKCVVKKGNKDIAGFIAKAINELTKKNNTIVILGFNELGPLLKTAKKHMRLVVYSNTRLFVPDTLLYNSMKAYMMPVDIENNEIKYSKSVAEMTEKRSKRNKIEVETSYSIKHDKVRKLGLIDRLMSVDVKTEVIILTLIMLLIIALVIPNVFIWPMSLANYIGTGSIFAYYTSILLSAINTTTIYCGLMLVTDKIYNVFV